MAAMRQSTARAWGLCLVMGSLCLPPRSAQAHAPAGLSLPELVRRSDATVLGHTVSQEAFWQNNRIVTRARVQVDELWAGGVRGAKFVDVLTLGGSVGDLGQRVDGAAQLPTYGRVVLHLSQVEDAYTPTGMASGVWHVDTLWGSEGRLTRLLALHEDGEPAFQASAKDPHIPKSLAALRRAVREAADAR